MIAFLRKYPFLYALLFWMLAGFFLLLAGDFIVMPIVAGHLKFTREVPQLVGLPGAKAEKLLEERNLRFKWDSVGRYSSQIPAGAVLIQIPEAGRRVRAGRTVHLTASKGLREVAIPDLRGKSQRQAEISLQRLGLQVARWVPGAHISIPRGVVIRTEPPAGKLVRVGQSVDVIISAGVTTGKAQLSNLIGLPLERAAVQLDSLGFALGSVVRKPSSDKLPNTVLDQHPKSGEFLEPGSTVDLTIAD